MSAPLPPPPPPLVLPVTLNDEDADKESALEGYQDNLIITTLKLWVITTLSETESNQALHVAMWKDKTSTILQSGPQCGLVALTMAAQSLGTSLDTAQVHRRAIIIGITKQGEMFNAKHLNELALSFGLNSSLLNDGLKDYKSILRHLSDGKLLLVPYDADCNHSPCLKNGHRAHWALIFGFMLRCPAAQTTNFLTGSQVDDLGSNILRIRVKGYDADTLWSNVNKDQVQLMARQGRSKRVAVWDYISMEASNDNLNEVDPKRNDPLQYVLPVGNSLADDLRGKVILLGPSLC